MRDDMFKVIVERPRWGSRHAPPVKLKKCRNPDVKFVGHKRHAKTEARYFKGLNENLAPLVRFLRSRKGRPWDEVFSEICLSLDTGSTVKMHVRLHLEDFVLIGIRRGRAGEWMCKGRIVDPQNMHFRRRYCFVDPFDGLLKGCSELDAAIKRWEEADHD